MFENFNVWYGRLGSDDDCPFTVACRDREVKNSERWVLVSFTEEAKKICEYIQEQIHLHEGGVLIRTLSFIFSKRIQGE